jgi:hypothetical protein
VILGKELAVEFDAQMIIGLQDADSERIGRYGGFFGIAQEQSASVTSPSAEGKERM